MIGATLAWGSYFAGYQFFKDEIVKYNQRKSANPQDAPASTQLGPGGLMLAAALAGAHFCFSFLAQCVVCMLIPSDARCGNACDYKSYLGRQDPNVRTAGGRPFGVPRLSPCAFCGRIERKLICWARCADERRAGGGSARAVCGSEHGTAERVARVAAVCRVRAHEAVLSDEARREIGTKMASFACVAQWQWTGKEEFQWECHNYK